jgi:hypothetical protein
MESIIAAFTAALLRSSQASGTVLQLGLSWFPAQARVVVPISVSGEMYG